MHHRSSQLLIFIILPFPLSFLASYLAQLPSYFLRNLISRKIFLRRPTFLLLLPYLSLHRREIAFALYPSRDNHLPTQNYTLYIIAPKGSSSAIADNTSRGSSDSDSSTDRAGTKGKCVDTKPKRRSELILDLSDPDARIADTIKKLRKKCWGWVAKPLREVPLRSFDLGPPAARIVDGRPLFDEALHDFTVFAVRSYYDKSTGTKYTSDFEAGISMK